MRGSETYLAQGVSAVDEEAAAGPQHVADPSQCLLFDLGMSAVECPTRTANARSYGSSPGPRSKLSTAMQRTPRVLRR